VQADEATDCSGTGYLIAYVRHVEDKTINEVMLFCKPIETQHPVCTTLDFQHWQPSKQSIVL
jgi:hypothetical protein